MPPSRPAPPSTGSGGSGYGINVKDFGYATVHAFVTNCVLKVQGLGLIFDGMNGRHGTINCLINAQNANCGTADPVQQAGSGRSHQYSFSGGCRPSSTLSIRSFWPES